MEKIVVRDNKIIKHNFKGKVLESVRKTIDKEPIIDGKYNVIDLGSHFDFKKIK